MNRFDDAVRDLLSTVSSGPGIDGLRTRVRRRRRRRAVAIVATVGVISFASVGVAASLGHDSSSPHIAVSPTSSTTTTVARRCSEVDAFAATGSQRSRRRRSGSSPSLKTATDAHAADVDVLDAQHQAVLRELSDVVERRLRLDAGDACAAANDPTMPSSTVPVCEDDPARDVEYAALDHQRVTLRDLDRNVNGQLDAARAANSSDAGVLDAKHQAILRRLADVEQQILAVESGPRVNPPCVP